MRLLVSQVPFLLLLSSLAGVAKAQDSVHLRDGRSETGKIENEDYKEITLKKGTVIARLLQQDVVGVQYGGSPEYNKVSTALGAGNLAEALPMLQDLATTKDKLKVPTLRQHVLFQLASVQQHSGKAVDAIAGYSSLLKEFPKSSHLIAAVQNMVDCFIASKDFAGGSAALQAQIEAARAAGVEASYLSSLDLQRGRLLEAQKKIGEARLIYEGCAAMKGLPPAVLGAARLGVARCEQAEGKPDKARELYRAVVELDASNEVLAGAWNGIADLTIEDGQKTNDSAKLLDGLFCYLRGVVEFGPAPGEPTGEYERALAGAARVFKALADLEKDDARKKTLTDRGNQRLNQLKKEFPDSPWLKPR